MGIGVVVGGWIFSEGDALRVGTDKISGGVLGALTLLLYTKKANPPKKIIRIIKISNLFINGIVSQVFIYCIPQYFLLHFD